MNFFEIPDDWEGGTPCESRHSSMNSSSTTHIKLVEKEKIITEIQVVKNINPFQKFYKLRSHTFEKRFYVRINSPSSV